MSERERKRKYEANASTAAVTPISKPNTSSIKIILPPYVSQRDRSRWIESTASRLQQVNRTYPDQNKSCWLDRATNHSFNQPRQGEQMQVLHKITTYRWCSSNSCWNNIISFDWYIEPAGWPRTFSIKKACRFSVTIYAYHLYHVNIIRFNYC